MQLANIVRNTFGENSLAFCIEKRKFRDFRKGIFRKKTVTAMIRIERATSQVANQSKWGCRSEILTSKLI